MREQPGEQHDGERRASTCPTGQPARQRWRLARRTAARPRRPVAASARGAVQRHRGLTPSGPGVRTGSRRRGTVRAGSRATRTVQPARTAGGRCAAAAPGPGRCARSWLACSVHSRRQRRTGTGREPAGIRVASFDFVENRVLGRAVRHRARARRVPGDAPPRPRTARGRRAGAGAGARRPRAGVRRAARCASSTTGGAGTRRRRSARRPRRALAERGLLALRLRPGAGPERRRRRAGGRAERHGLRRGQRPARRRGGPDLRRPARVPGAAAVPARAARAVRPAVPRASSRSTSRAATAEALLAGQLDVGMLETVDAYLADGRLVLLADDRGLQPAGERRARCVREDGAGRARPRLVRAAGRGDGTADDATAIVELDRAGRAGRPAAGERRRRTAGSTHAARTGGLSAARPPVDGGAGDRSTVLGAPSAAGCRCRDRSPHVLDRPRRHRRPRRPGPHARGPGRQRPVGMPPAVGTRPRRPP